MSFKQLKIKDFADVVTGGTPSTAVAEYWDNGIIPWLNSGELNQEIVVKSDNFISEEGLKNSAARVMPKDTVLIALTGATTGVVGYLTFDACANQSVTGILPSEIHYPKYLYYYLKSIRAKVLSDSYGGAQKHISQGYVKEIEISLPSLPIQKRIAEILDTADELKRKDKVLLKKYDELTQTIFIDMFGDPVKNEKGWNEIPLSEICIKITDGTHLSPKFTSKGIPFLFISNIVDNEIVYETDTFISEEEFEILNRRTPIEIGNILLTTVGSYGNPAIIEKNNKFAFQRHIAFIKPNHELVNYFYLFGFLQSPKAKTQIDRKVNGIAQKTLNLGDLKELKVWDVPRGLQDIYEKKLKLLKEIKNKKTDHSTTDLFSSLIQKAFKGELT